MGDVRISGAKDAGSLMALPSDAAVGDMVSKKFLQDINQAMTGPVGDPSTEKARQDAFQDLSGLTHDRQQNVVLEAIASKIVAHDPAMGTISGKVERATRDKNEITGFDFINPDQQAVYHNELAQYMWQGHTQAQAELNFYERHQQDIDRMSGHLHVYEDGSQTAYDD